MPVRCQGRQVDYLGLKARSGTASGEADRNPVKAKWEVGRKNKLFVGRSD